MSENKTNQSKPDEARRRFTLFPKTLSASVEQVVKPVYKKHGFAEHRILTQWNAIVGAELAAYCLPQKLVFAKNKKDGGVLHVLVASARALELQHMQPVILDKIAMYFGYPAVAKLKFTQSSSALLRKEKISAPLQPKTPGKGLVSLVAQCEDEDLRKALLSLGSMIAAVEK